LTQEYEGTNEDFQNNSLQIYRTVLEKFVMVDTYKGWEEQFTGFKNNLHVLLFGDL
jgi:hypothetical protein